MIHAREDYNRIQDPENQIPIDEPVFLLRGQDKVAPDLIRLWAKRVRDAGGSEEIAVAAEKQADEMDKWQENVCSKVPDMPK